MLSLQQFLNSQEANMTCAHHVQTCPQTDAVTVQLNTQ